MNFNWFVQLFSKKNPIIRFKSVHGNFAVATPVLPVTKFKAKWQLEQSKEDSIVHCPGMHDFLSSGYIVSAHCDIRIKANRVGTVVTLNAASVNIHEIPNLTPSKLDPRLIKSRLIPSDKVKLEVCKIPLPWAVFTPPGYSVYFLPCTLQADYLDKLMVWPGVIDCDTYHHISFIFSAKEECEVLLPAGTPLVHIIPFKREVFDGVCNKATDEEEDIYKYHVTSRVGQVYRKFFHSKKKFNMSGMQDHRFL
jgi:hypothetical protein